MSSVIFGPNEPPVNIWCFMALSLILSLSLSLPPVPVPGPPLKTHEFAPKIPLDPSALPLQNPLYLSGEKKQS